MYRQKLNLFNLIGIDFHLKEIKDISLSSAFHDEYQSNDF